MKDFWWRKRTDPPPLQPPRHVEFKTPDASSTLWTIPTTTRETARWGSRLGLHRENRCFQSLPPPSKDLDHVSEGALAGEMAGSAVDRLQETIRFVFSHEQEGLLAIGTFALDQLAGVRVDELKPAVSTADQTCHRNSTGNPEFQSETGFQQSSVKELHVFGDDDALSNLHQNTLPVVLTTKTLPIASVHKDSSASTSLDLSTGSANLVDTECTPDLADSECTPEHYQSDDEVFSPGEVFSSGVCGLLGSRSRRKQKLGEKQNQNQLKPPVTTTDQTCRSNSTSNPEFQSETGFQQSSVKELHVFGDDDAPSYFHPGNLPVVEITKTLTIAPVLKSIPASTENSSTGSSNLADTECNLEHYQSDDEVFSSGFCGLLVSRSRRKQKLGEKQNQKQLPPEKRDGLEKDAFLQASVNLEKPDKSKGFKVSSLGRLWRPRSGRPPITNQVSPAPELSPTVARESAQLPGVPCIANVELDGAPKAAAALKFSSELPYQALLPCEQKAGEGGERIRRASFGSGAWACAQNGKWIRTDSEFVVLEM